MEGMMALGIVVSLKDMFTGPAKQVVSSIKKIENASNFGKKLMTSGTQMAAVGSLYTGIGREMRGAMESVMAPAMAFEDALAAVGTVAGGTFGSVKADMDMVAKAARSWSLAHVDSASSFTRASYMMISAGLDTRKAIAGTQSALALATATMGDSTEAANLLATVYSNLGNKVADPQAEMTRLGDILARAQQYFKIANLGQLSEGLKYATPSARQFGISVEQLNVALGTLNTAGIEGGMAGTTFAATMRQMIKASRDLGFNIARTADGGVDFIKTIENIKAKFGTFDQMTDKTRLALQRAFGEEGLRGLTTFMDATDKMKTSLGEVANSMGTTINAQRRMEATGSSALKILRNHLDELKITLAQDLAPAFMELVASFKGIIGSVKAFVSAHPDLTALAAKWFLLSTAALLVVGPIAAVGGSILTMAGGGIRAIGGLMKAVIWLKAGGFAKLVRPIFAVERALKWMGTIGFKTATLLGRGVLSLSSVIGKSLWRALTTVIPAVWSFAAALLANPITWIVLGIVALIAAIVALIVYWDDVVAAFGRGAEWLKVAWNQVGVFFSNLWAGIVDAFWAAVDAVKKALGSAWNWVVETFNGILEFITGLPGRMFDAGLGLFNALLDGLKAAAGNVLGFVQETFAAIRDWLPFSDAKTGPLSDLTRSGRAFVTTWTGGMRSQLPELSGTMARFTSQLELKAPELPVLTMENTGIRAGAGPARETGRLHIENLTLNVSAKDVDEQESVTRLFVGLAEQYG